MANLFDIKADIMHAFDAAVDPETGEMLDEEAYKALDELKESFDEKVENILCWIKNLRSDADAIKAEKQAFAERQKRLENKADRLAAYLDRVLDGTPREYQRASVSFRNSECVVVDDLGKIDDEYLVFKDPDVDKMKLKRDLKSGAFILGAHIEKKRNIQIK